MANMGLTQFIPRGALVQNCQMVAVVVYTGQDSKIILNQGHYSYKRSSMEKKMNKIFSFQLVQVVALPLTFMLLYAKFLRENQDLP